MFSLKLYMLLWDAAGSKFQCTRQKHGIQFKLLFYLAVQNFACTTEAHIADWESRMAVNILHGSCLHYDRLINFDASTDHDSCNCCVKILNVQLCKNEIRCTILSIINIETT
uniref:Secreted protein n=1 Tax=Picea sitchensis TaxID=3332 RepID=D5ADT7_PICSI|nr:unknown [Picea sitchensis]